MIKAVIFDFDGTLAPLLLNFDHMRAEIERLARQYVSDQEVERLRHLYVIEMIYEVEKVAQDKEASFRRAAFDRLGDLEVAASKGNRPYPYTREVLISLRESGLKLAVATRNCLKALTTVFPEIQTYVDAIVTRDDTDLVKPHPAHAQRVLAQIAVAPAEAILVGDHPTDILAGKALNMRTVGVLTGRTQREAFEEAGASHVAQDIRALIELAER